MIKYPTHCHFWQKLHSDENAELETYSESIMPNIEDNQRGRNN